MSNIVLVAQDAAPSAAFKLLLAELAKRDVSTKSFLGEGTKRDLTDHAYGIANAIHFAAAVVLGMASCEELAKLEVNAGMYAYACKIPIALYADSCDCIERKWFKPLRHRARFIFVVDEEEKTVAERLFPKAHVIISGNPLWQNAVYVPLSREEARKELALAPAERMIFCALTKNAEVNMELLHALAVAVQLQSIRGIVGFHPGDRTDRSVYAEFLSGRTRIEIATKGTKKVLPAADVVLNGTSGVGIEAVAQGIPVLELKGPAIMAEEHRIYPGGWKLPERHPELVRETDESGLHATLGDLLRRENEWKGIVGDPPTALAIKVMADEIELFGAYC